MCYYAPFGRSGTNGTSVRTDPPETVVRLSRSLKVIGTDRDPSATYDFLLVVHNNYEPLL